MAGAANMTVEQAVTHVNDFLTGATGTAAKAAQSATGVLNSATVGAEGTTTVPGSMSQLEGSLVPEAGKLATPSVSQETNLAQPVKWIGGQGGDTTVTPTAAAPTPSAPMAPAAPGTGVFNSATMAPAAPSAPGSTTMGNLTVPGAPITPYQPTLPLSPPGPSAGMSEWAKYAAMTTGAQGLAGLASGYYEGLSAEQKLQFDQMVNKQQNDQRLYLNRNNSYSPLVRFRGVLNS
jgi:hypothetical protein